MTDTFERYSGGELLYGDDFSTDQIESWFRDETDAYFNLGEKPRSGQYGYHALNWHHGFRHLPSVPFEHVLGIGSAFGEELSPILNRAKKVTIIEPSEGFHNPAYQYVKPDPTWRMMFADGTFDLITCFGVLHHIPNVSTVLSELARCMTPGGWLLLREPNNSMGNWDLPRRGLTHHERGIPLKIHLRIIYQARLRIFYQSRCMFSLTSRIELFLRAGQSVYNTRWIVSFDAKVSNLSFWSKCYHPTNLLSRLRPWATFLILRKP
jgi:SAM-dependent methyltransferase